MEMMMSETGNSRLIVVGASAGGMAALTELIAQFPEDFPAAIFIVNHMGQIPLVTPWSKY